MTASHATIGSAVNPPLKVLVVDDNPLNRDVLGEMIRGDGHAVATAVDGLDGVTKALAHTFDLILMDISMPRMGGLEAARAIRLSDAATPIYAVTAHAMPEEYDHFLRCGLNGAMLKPVKKAELCALLREISAANMNTVTEAEKIAAPISARSALGVDILHVEEMASILGKEVMSKKLDEFQSNASKSLLELHKSAKTRDIAEIQQIAHQFSGLCATFGAVQLNSSLSSIETACKRGDPVKAISIISTLDPIWATARRDLLAAHANTQAFPGPVPEPLSGSLANPSQKFQTNNINRQITLPSPRGR